MVKVQDLSSAPITQLTGVGPARSTQLSKLGITTVQDLLLHLPNRYEDRTRVTPIHELQVDESAVVEGTIINQILAHRRNRTPGIRCVLQDQHGDTLNIELLYNTAYQRRLWTPEQRVKCHGTVKKNQHGLCMYHPEHMSAETGNDGALTPVYPSTKGVHQTVWRRLMRHALDKLSAMESRTSHTTLPLPPNHHSLPTGEIYRDLNELSIVNGLRYLHSPEAGPEDDRKHQLARCRNRLAFEELLANYLYARKLTQPLQKQPAIAIKKPGNNWEQSFLERLPFRLTNAQRKAVEEINHDIDSPYAMRRLLQGDTGSGKTVVAAMVALRVIAGGNQVAVMVPTEVLLEQHYRSFSEWFAPLAIKTAQLRGTHKPGQREQIIKDLETGKINLVVGTHSLLQGDVRFKKLGLNIIDEQHLFGVQQRLVMQQKTVVHRHPFKPHQLIMTATPIPRTFFMIQYSGLSCSFMDEMPSGRKTVTTALVSEKRRDQVVQRVRKACLEGRQGFWICPFIHQSETLSAQSVEEAAAAFREQCPDVRIGILHGKRSPEETVSVINDMRAGRIDLLVATTIVGVGVDIPKASLMVIDSAERLGLAQLHQLRGRIGRGKLEGHCILIYGNCPERTLQRLHVLRQHDKGIDIAQHDLSMRGPGEISGTPQSGLVKFKIADMQRDTHLIEPVRRYGDWLMTAHPDSTEVLVQRWRVADQAYTSV